ncbi:MAG TPA: cytochrome c oxidase assembly protein [Gaiellales bacterium]
MSGRRIRGAALAAGIATACIAVAPPVDAIADRTLAGHMLQHMLLTTAAAPLIVIGSPVLLALRVAPAPARRSLARLGRRRALHLLASPALGWTLLPALQAGVYATPLLAATERSEPLHAAVHAALLAAGLLFWRPVLGADPMPRLPALARVGYLLAAMPASDAIGIWLIASAGVHYPAAVTTGIADQRRAGTIMLSGSFVLGAAALWAAWSWVRRDELRTALREGMP